MWEFIQQQLLSNQFLSGGALLAGVGLAFAYLRRVPTYIFSWVRRRLITEIDIPDRDESFRWLNVWLSKHPYHTRCRLWTVHTRRSSRREEYMGAGEENLEKTKKLTVILSPAPGIHFLFYQRRLMILYRERKDGADKGGGGSSATFGFRETFKITLFSRHREVVINLLEEAQLAANPVNDERLTIMQTDYDNWVPISRRMPRPIASVILPQGDTARILDDVKLFQESASWYNQRGIPYRRGYLLHGEPGNGKSSLVIAIASELQCDICMLNLNAKDMTDERLLSVLANVPAKSVVLIEDIDCVFNARARCDGKDALTFSGLLNAIDGVMASEGRILFVTTNHIEKLDPALIRPGRIDLTIGLRNASSEQMGQLFARFFPLLPDMAVQFSLRGEPNQWSMATLQGHLLKYRDDPVLALTAPIVSL